MGHTQKHYEIHEITMTELYACMFHWIGNHGVECRSLCGSDVT